MDTREEFRATVDLVSARVKELIEQANKEWPLTEEFVKHNGCIFWWARTKNAWTVLAGPLSKPISRPDRDIHQCSVRLRTEFVAAVFPLLEAAVNKAAKKQIQAMHNALKTPGGPSADQTEAP